MDEGQKLHNKGERLKNMKKKGIKYGENEVNKGKDGKVENQEGTKEKEKGSVGRKQERRK